MNFELRNLQIADESDDAQVYLELIRTIRAWVNKMKKHVKEPQPGLPDVFFWMISGGKRVAYARIPAAKLLYSPTSDLETGTQCAKMQTIFLKVGKNLCFVVTVAFSESVDSLQLPGRHSSGQSGWSIQAKLELFLWLSHSRNRKEAFEKLPPGCELENEVEDPFKTLKPNKAWQIPRLITFKS